MILLKRRALENMTLSIRISTFPLFSLTSLAICRRSGVIGIDLYFDSVQMYVKLFGPVLDQPSDNLL